MHYELGRRNGDDDARAAIFGKLGPNLSAVQVDDLVADVKTKSKSGAMILVIRLVVTLKDVATTLGDNPRPVISYCNLNEIDEC